MTALTCFFPPIGSPTYSFSSSSARADAFTHAFHFRLIRWHVLLLFGEVAAEKPAYRARRYRVAVLVLRVAEHFDLHPA